MQSKRQKFGLSIQDASQIAGSTQVGGIANEEDSCITAERAVSGALETKMIPPLPASATVYVFQTLLDDEHLVSHMLVLYPYAKLYAIFLFKSNINIVQS